MDNIVIIEWSMLVPIYSLLSMLGTKTTRDVNRQQNISIKMYSLEISVDLDPIHIYTYILSQISSLGKQPRRKRLSTEDSLLS